MTDIPALVIDDNDKNISVLVRLLAREGLNSIRVLNPVQIDDVLATLDRVCVVFLDLEMPRMDGYEILARLKADPRFADVPVVAYTVHTSEINTAHKRGFNGFLGKPLDPDRFPDQLARILRGEPVWEKL